MFNEFKFNKDEYKNYVDNIKLSEFRKNTLKSKMTNESCKISDLNSNDKILNTYYKIWTKVVAAVLAIVIVGGSTYLLCGKNQNQNSFMITASAAEVEIGSSEIKIASYEMVNGFPMQIFNDESVEPYLNKMGKQDLFTEFKFNDLVISGENIESISFETSKNFSYFHVYSDNIDNEFSDIDELTHSQYSISEFEEYYEAYTGYMCDRFTFINRNSKNEIRLNDIVYFMTESDWSDEEIAEWMNIVCDCFDKHSEYKMDLYNKTGGVGGGVIPDEQVKIEELADKYISKINKKLIEDAEIDITVKFTDGTIQSKTLLLGFDCSGEESFLTAKTI